MAPLAGSSVVIIGGSQGLGFGVAKMASDAGARVTIVARNRDRLERAREGIDGDVTARSLDATDEGAVKELFEDLDSVDHVAMFTSKGVTTAGRSFSEIDAGSYWNEWRNAYWPAMHVCRFAPPRMANGGSILFCTGISADGPMRHRFADTECERALEGFASVMALELGPIRVNTIRPGILDNEERLRRYLGDRADEAIELIAREAPVILPAGRIGRVDELAHAARFLMENEYVTGVILAVDGGHSLIRRYPDFHLINAHNERAQ